MGALYISERGDVSGEDMLRGLQAIGVKEGDVIFVHSDMSAFGKIAAEGSAQLLGNLVETLRRAVGETGTLVMPTFSYSFCKNEPFDPA